MKNNIFMIIALTLVSGVHQAAAPAENSCRGFDAINEDSVPNLAALTVRQEKALKNSNSQKWADISFEIFEGAGISSRQLWDELAQPTVDSMTKAVTDAAQRLGRSPTLAEIAMQVKLLKLSALRKLKESAEVVHSWTQGELNALEAQLIAECE
ncbi:hypothetical protein A3J41_03120 [candidate division TM6 bacterium RIFCSPHIGHO2_12_FULL_38_8]|nr:MAG: hypothetical protein A3J41_03120 [candidate division TM6 bacterium RIFCSPHIGHO2_12_FULL_38_8]